MQVDGVVRPYLLRYTAIGAGFARAGRMRHRKLSGVGLVNFIFHRSKCRVWGLFALRLTHTTGQGWLHIYSPPPHPPTSPFTPFPFRYPLYLSPSPFTSPFTSFPLVPPFGISHSHYWSSVVVKCSHSHYWSRVVTYESSPHPPTSPFTPFPLRYPLYLSPLPLYLPLHLPPP